MHYLLNRYDMRRHWLLFILPFLFIQAEAKVVPARIFQSGMVLQRNNSIPVWGTASVGEKFEISFNKRIYPVEADTKGNWRIDLPKMKAGGPYTMTIAGEQFEDILIGDVWLCSGQSNMDVDIERVSPQYLDLVRNYSNDLVRLLRVDQVATVSGPRTDFKTAGWKHLNPKDAWKFSAIGYFLGKNLQESTKVPQGIICNSWGGTPIESWIPSDSLQKDFPQYLKRRNLYTPEYVATQTKANQLMNDGWWQLLNRTDLGLKEGWTGLDYDDSAWTSCNQYSKDWAQVDGRGVVGSIWMRQHVKIDASHAGKPALLVLGTLYDADITYVNGQQVGITYYQYPPRRYNIPAGMLHEGDNVISVRFVNKNGTPAFTQGKKYQIEFADGEVLRMSEQWKSRIGTQMPGCPQEDVSIQYLPTVMHDCMLNPVVPYSIAGVVWNQGESNAGYADEYLAMLRKLKGDWRARFDKSDLPFVIVQLANYMAPSAQPQETGWAVVREAQRLSTVEDSRSELAVAIDVGEANDIHPLRKKEVADRVALAFQKLYYGKKVALSPRPLTARVNEDLVIVTFDQKLRSGDMMEFELKGSDGRYHNATAHADENEVTIDCGDNTAPTMVRYAWKNNPEKAGIYNVEGLPGTPFQITIDR